MSQDFVKLSVEHTAQWLWLACDGLESHQGGVDDSHPLIITENGDKHF